MTDTILTNKPKLNCIIDMVLYCLAIISIPNIFLFDLYNRNRVQSHLPFMHTLIIAITLAVVSIGLLLLFRLISRSLEGALIVTSIFWVTFWLFEALYAIVIVYSASVTRLGWLVFIIAGLILIAGCLRMYNPPLGKIPPVFRILAVTLCGLFIFNFMPALNHQLMLQRGVNLRYEAFLRGEELFYIKRDFRIDPLLPSPDIYWFYMDGMMSLESVERFFGESQDPLREELTRRGFVIYEEATLNAGNTTYALPALLSPSFYDTYLSIALEEAIGLTGSARSNAMNDRLSQDGINLIIDIAPYFELFQAFASNEYKIVGINLPLHATMLAAVSFDSFYNKLDVNYPLGIKVDDIDADSNSWNRILWELSGWTELFNLSTPFSIISDPIIPLPPETQWIAIQEHEIADTLTRYTTVPMLFQYSPNHIYVRSVNLLYNAVADSLLSYSPKLTFITNMFAHASRWRLHSNSAAQDLARIDLYTQAYNFAAETMINKIDLILEQNPNAVIILQSDHGIHPEDSLNALRELGWTEDEILQQLLSVFSAVRIPSQYGGLDFPLEPRNISRELVNRFVGENYTLLPDRYRN